MSTNYIPVSFPVERDFFLYHDGKPIAVFPNQWSAPYLGGVVVPRGAQQAAPELPPYSWVKGWEPLL